MKKKIVFVILMVLWVMIIFSFSLQNGTDSSNTSNSTLDVILKCFFVDIDNLKLNNYDLYYTLGSVLRKCAHFTEYAILGVISFSVFKKISLSFALCVLVASVDEILQTFISNRNGSITDVLIDSLGAICGVMMIYFIIKKIDKRRISHD